MRFNDWFAPGDATRAGRLLDNWAKAFLITGTLLLVLYACLS